MAAKMPNVSVQSQISHYDHPCHHTVNVFNEIVPEMSVEVRCNIMWPSRCVCCWCVERSVQRRGESFLVHAQPHWLGSWVSTDLLTHTHTCAAVATGMGSQQLLTFYIKTGGHSSLVCSSFQV